MGPEDLPTRGHADNDPTQDDDDRDTFDMIREWHKDSSRHLADWREEAVECYGFVSGSGQWSEEDKRVLMDQDRPPVTFNRVAPVVDSVTGMEVNHRNDTTYIPRQVDQQGVNDLLTNAAKFFRDEGEAEDEESDAFYDVVVCGLGCTETRPDFEEDPEGLIPVTRIDPLSTWYDPNSHKRNLTDRRYCGYDKEIAIEEARAMFPDADDSDLDAAWARPERADANEPHDATPSLAYNQGDQGERGGMARKTVMLVYCEWFETEKYHLAVDPFTGKKGEFTPAQVAKARSRLKVFGIPFETAQLSRRKFYHAFVGGKVLGTGPGRCPQDFTLVFMTGKRDRNTNTWFGIVRAMMDPQRWANKFFSQILYIINSNAKGGIVAERDAFEDPRKVEADWARSDAVIWARPGAISGEKFQQRQAIVFPVGLDKLMEYAAGSIPDVTGVNLEVLGLADREQAGVLEYQRKQSGMTVLATLFDSLRRYRKQQGRAMLYIMCNYIPPGRLIRIDSDDGPKYIPFLKDPNTVKYDVIVDESPTSPNQKEAIWSMVMAMMPMLSKAPIPTAIWAEILKYSPLPESVAQKIGGMLSQAAAQPPPPDPKVQAIQAKAQADIQASQQQMQLDQQRSQMEMQNDQRAAQAQAANDQRDAQNEARDNHQEFLESMARDRMKMQAEIEGMRAKAAAEIEIERQKGDVQVEVARKVGAVQARKAGAKTNG